jgi:hypothetical protein
MQLQLSLQLTPPLPSSLPIHSRCLIELLVFRGYPFSHSESDIEAVFSACLCFLLLISAAGLRANQVQSMVEELCFVAGDFKREMRLAAETTAHVVSYHLCDGRDINLGPERFQACEVLFQPHLFGIDGSSGLAQEVSCLSHTERLCTTNNKRVRVCRYSTAFKVWRRKCNHNFGEIFKSPAKQPPFPASNLDSRKSSRCWSRRTF